MRDVEGWPVEIACREVAGLHELSPEGANDGEDEKSRLPSPKNFLLTKHDRESLEILIGDHIEFCKKVKAPETAEAYEVLVAPPAKAVLHYLKYRRSALPRVHAVLTMPLVLPDGKLLACNGLDRKRRAVFRIEPGLLPFIPAAEACTGGAVQEAFQFLTEEWLCDASRTFDAMSDISHQKLLTVLEVATAIRKNERFVRRGIRDGKIPAVRFGRDAMIHEEIVLEMQRHGLTGSRHFSTRPRAEE
jgi:hypothetical protein